MRLFALSGLARRAPLVAACVLCAGSPRSSHAQRRPPHGETLGGEWSPATFADRPGRATGTPALWFQWGRACAQAQTRTDVVLTNPGGVHEGFTVCVLHTPRRQVGFSSAHVHLIAAVRTAPHEGVDCAAAVGVELLRDAPRVLRAEATPRIDEDGVRVAQVDLPADALSEDAPLARAWGGWMRGWSVSTTASPAGLRLGVVRSEVIEWDLAEAGPTPQLTALTLPTRGLPERYWDHCVARWGLLVTTYATTPFVAQPNAGPPIDPARK